MTLFSQPIAGRSSRAKTISLALASFALGVFVFASCGSGLLPLQGRNEIPQPSVVVVNVTPAPESPTATPWPLRVGDDARAIPDGLDPEFFTAASAEETVNMWTQFLTGSTMQTSSDRDFFRGRGRFDGELHMCPAGNGYLVGDPTGDANWIVSPTIGEWYEVALTHEIPGRVESVTLVLGIHDGMPVQSGNTEAIVFSDSDHCSNTDPAFERPSFTVEERRLDVKRDSNSAVVPNIPWVNGKRVFPAQLSDIDDLGDSSKSASDYWNAYLLGGSLDAVAYEYGTFVLTKAFSGSLHMCEGRVAVLDGAPSGIGEWGVRTTSPGTLDAKILFTLPGERTFRTLALSVTNGEPVLMGRIESTGLIGPTPLVLTQSTECGGG
jgi:hypothetical protein